MLTNLRWVRGDAAAPAVTGQELRRILGEDKRVAFISGNFNVVHPGHLRLFKFATDMSDRLVIGLNPDTAPGVSVPVAMREEGLRAISMVDFVVPLDGSANGLIASLRPDFVVKGKEFETQHNSEKAVVESYGGKLVFGSGEVRFSSLDLLHREYRADFSTIRTPIDYPHRYGFDFPALKRRVSAIAGIRVLVIGDLIVDEYVSCDPLGMSQEDPTIVVTPVETRRFVGGAGIVSAHANSLGASVRFCTVTGADEAAEFSENYLSDQGVEVHALADRTRPTTVKLRYRAHGKTLLRVNQLRQHSIEPDIARTMLETVERHLESTDLVLFSDFNYGCLPQPLVDAICERAAARKIMMCADSQASSQISDISRFKGMALITPTEREARLALRDSSTGLAALCENLASSARASNVVITLGSEGLIVFCSNGNAGWTDQLPAFNSAPRDVAGAGDSLFATTSLALCAGADIWQSTYLGALAAACQVSRVGNTPLTHLELMKEIDATN